MTGNGYGRGPLGDKLSVYFTSHSHERTISYPPGLMLAVSPSSPTVTPEFHIQRCIHVLVGDRLFNWYKHHCMGLMTVKS